MSHELRSPLNVILRFSRLLRRRELPQGIDEDLDTILRSGEHLLTLINDVLDLSKIEAGRVMLRETAFDLHQLLEDLDDMFALRASS